MLRLLDELAGTAVYLFSMLFALTHLGVWLQPSILPLWQIFLSAGIGILLGLWGMSRIQRLVRRLRRLWIRRQVARALKETRI